MKKIHPPSTPSALCLPRHAKSSKKKKRLLKMLYIEEKPQCKKTFRLCLLLPVPCNPIVVRQKYPYWSIAKDCDRPYYVLNPRILMSSVRSVHDLNLSWTPFSLGSLALLARLGIGAARFTAWNLCCSLEENLAHCFNLRIATVVIGR